MTRTLASALILLSLSGCGLFGGGTTDTDKPGLFDDPDSDGDGVNFDADCDDEDPSIFPGATERCDPADIDEDCNGLADNADPGATGGITVLHDADDDGYGEEASALSACEPSPGYIAVDGDCDDADPEIHPGAAEICDPADVDEDCNSVADDADPNVLALDQVEVWIDADGDGYGDAGRGALACDPPAGWVDESTDCDDDIDSIYPGATEVCDGADNDCDGYADGADVTEWYRDGDDHGYGGPDGRSACAQPEGFVSDSTDCDDDSADVYPTAPERCDGEDDDCDFAVDEADATDVSTWYRDADADGYGDATVTSTDCDAPTGYVADATDCDDTRGAIRPGGTEVCDTAGTDEDCDGYVDDDDWTTATSGMTAYYADSDGDTYGDPDVSEAACDRPTDHVTNDDDCDDSDATILPGGSEVCDADDDDEDCDGQADDDDTSVAASGKSTYYRDADADGYGVTTSTLSRCDLPSGYATLSTDCDDTTSARSPGRPEICDSANTDEDCDSLSDDNDSSVSASSCTTWHLDADADDYGLATSSLNRCEEPAGYTALGGDCLDSSASVNPGELEVCFDAVDDDCDGSERCDRTLNDADRQLVGEVAGDYAGCSVAGSDDQNSDGTDELFVGAYTNDAGGTDAGAAYLIEGGGSSTLDLSLATAIFIGEDAGDYAGISVAGLGDVNSDGRGDLLIGATGDDDGGSGAGKVYSLRGRMAGTVDLSIAYGKIVGENASDSAGVSVAAAGDVNNDGNPDALIGASGRSSNAGGVYLLTSLNAGVTDLSAATTILTGETSSDYAGLSVSGAGDVNADGYADFLAGAYGDDDGASSAGAAYLVLGPQSDTASLSTSDAKRRGVTSSDYAGYAVAGGGDVNNDGYDDVLIGAYGYGSYGAVYLELGPFTGTASLFLADARIEGSTGEIGRVIRIGGDIDGDAYGEILIGNPTDATDGSGAGSASVFLGAVSGTVSIPTADVYITGGASSERAGASVAFVGAQDGTAMSDLLIGATGDPDGGVSAGAAFLVSASGL